MSGVWLSAEVAMAAAALGTWVALPRESVPLCALLLAGSLLLFGGPLLARAVRSERSACTAAFLLAIAAAGLSALWLEFYLRGGPRIIDATAYYLEARGFAHGMLAFPLDDPEAAVMGRFLVRDTLAGATHGAVIFPPGYPAVLALGFLLHAPLSVGPVLAFLLTLASYDLGRTAAKSADSGAPAENARAVGLAAALLVTVCATLRYHTADTMSHGLAALLVTVSLSLALRLRARWTVATAAALGAALGLLFITRPVSGLATSVAIGLTLGACGSLRTLLVALPCMLPFAAFLLLYQRAASGSPWVSPQLAYYAQSDGPAGCFDYGFSDRIGCLREHGDFVRHNLPSGYGPIQALGTTLRRLKMHLGDALNAEPSALLVLVASIWAFRKGALRGLLWLLPLFALFYAPFYFDGNYPAGGARFFAEALPAELCLVALAAPTMLQRARAWRNPGLPRMRPERVYSYLAAVALVGFSVRGQLAHQSLREREGGVPMFRAAELPLAPAARLVFVDTDHGFLLGHDPGARADRGATEVVRLRGDQQDRWLWQARGQPTTLRYSYDVTSGETSVAPFVPPASRWIKAAGLWPPLAQHDAYALPGYGAESCGEASELILEVDGPSPAILLPAPLGLRGREFRAVFGPDSATTVPQLEVLQEQELRLTLRGDELLGRCRRSAFARLPAGGEGRIRLRLSGAEGPPHRLSLVGLELSSEDVRP